MLFNLAQKKKTKPIEQQAVAQVLPADNQPINLENIDDKNPAKKKNHNIFKNKKVIVNNKTLNDRHNLSNTNKDDTKFKGRFNAHIMRQIGRAHV